jgi:hypothetical protein
VIKDIGYIPGEGMMSPARDIFYLNIPKNASTYLSNILLANNWEHWNVITDTTTVQYSIAFIRDPLDRWISGFSTYVALHLLGNGYGSDHFVEDYNEATERLIFNQVIFDDHTDLQCNFINQIALNNPVYFRYNTHLVKQINLLTGYNLNTNIVVESNRSDSNYDTLNISKFIQNKLNEKPDLKAKVIDAYKDDYDFIKNTEFYNEPR